MAKAGVPGWQATAGLSPQPCHSAPLGHVASHPHPLIRNLGLFLRKRFIIETLFNKLKSGMGLEHTRHRSPINALVHIVSCLAAYYGPTQGNHCQQRPHPQLLKPSLTLSETEVM